jgi:hypothetical protein
MKRYLFTPLLVLFLTGTVIRAEGQEQESLGLPGDNLNLYAVMKLFQESETLEGFERSLNDENTRINNLDLNGDGQVDYIRVIDNIDGNVHNIVLQVAVNPKENQDVAVFTVWRESDDRVQIQLTGDESLYGRNYIIEPIFDEGNRGQTPNPGYIGNTETINGHNVVVNRTTTVEIATWPLVRFIFLPTYVVWHSPWYYSYYPSYWNPWRPYYWDYYYGYHYNNYSYYYGHYRHWDDHRYPRWHDTYYSSRRSYSPDVHHRIEDGHYRETYSHPEQRREGTAMYNRTHPDQHGRSPNASTGHTTSRTSTTTETSRRPTTTAADRTPTHAETSRKSTEANTGNRSTTTETSKRSTSAESGNSKARQETGQNRSKSETNKQSATKGADKSTRRGNENKQSDNKGKSSGRTSESRTSK